MNMKALVVGLATGLLLAGASQAAVPVDVIRAFNQALEGDDPSAVIQSAEALIAAAVANPDDPAARSAAFEAGTQLCLRSACERALAAAPLMTGEGDAEISAVLANLLIVFATWSGEPTPESTEDFKLALVQVAPESPTLLTIRAFDAYHVDTLRRGKIADIRKAAEMAAAHYQPFWKVIPENWATVELSAAAAQFAEDQDDDVLDRFAKLEVALYPFVLGDRKDRPLAESLYHQAYTWRLAIDAYFQSKDQRSSSAALAADAYVSAERKRLADSFYETRERPEKSCDGRITKAPEPKYPKSAQRAGYVGAVLVGFAIEEGEIANVRVLAAVPDSQFEESVLESMKSVRWAFDEQQADPNCKRSHSRVVYPFFFHFKKPEGSIRR